MKSVVPLFSICVSLVATYCVYELYEEVMLRGVSRSSSSIVARSGQLVTVMKTDGCGMLLFYN
jgi:hypothetical protein